MARKTPEQKQAARKERWDRFYGAVPDEGSLDCDEPASRVTKKAMLESMKQMRKRQSSQRVMF
jgi:hypothetical protein